MSTTIKVINIVLAILNTLLAVTLEYFALSIGVFMPAISADAVREGWITIALTTPLVVSGVVAVWIVALKQPEKVSIWWKVLSFGVLLSPVAFYFIDGIVLNLQHSF